MENEGMRRILFVDDNPSEVQELKKILKPMSHEWETEFAMSGGEALKIMGKFPFDVVVSNMHMPEMGGVELLDTVMERHPETVRIIHSGHSDKEMVLQSVRSAHQFLIKPCDAETMKYTIERACKLRDLLQNETLRTVITGIKNLPSYPTLYGLIIKEMQSPDASLKKVGYIISQDVSMSAKILQLVNSAFFGLPRKITDAQQAAVYLGIDTLKSLILSIHVFSSFTEDAESCGFSLAEMWRHSLRTGRLAKDIARAVTDDGKVAEEAMISGILHDIGKLILLKAHKQYKDVMDFIAATGCDHVQAEYAVMKTSHAELGAYLLGLWGLPDNIVEPVAFHHNPSKLLEGMFAMSGESSNKDTGKTKSDDKDLKTETLMKLLTGFATVTAVHVANALMMQENSSASATTFPYVDVRYLSKLNLVNRLPKWADSCNKIMQEDI
jgi:putative nucleotidyltransferase with HDIG domain